MKHTLIVSLVASFILVSSGAFAQEDCNAQKITVHANPGTGQITVTPTVFNQKKGCGIEMRIPNDYTTNILSDFDWLTGTGQGGSIYINVPQEEANGDYKYDVEIVGFGILDPFIRVN